MIEVSLAETIPEGLIGILSDGLLNAVLDDVAASARVKWIRIAQTELHSTRQDYIQAIGEIQTGEGSREIALIGWLANAIENGMDAYDMRDTLLANSSHVGKDGKKFAYIPFRHGTPGSTGLAGAPMGSAEAPHSSSSMASGSVLASLGQAVKLGKAIHQEAKKLRGSRRLGTGVGGASLLQPWHKTDIYAGMKRQRKPYVNQRTGKTTTQTQYTTFRTISENSDPSAWQHPGIQARHFADQVAAHVDRIIPAIMNRAIKEALK